VSADAFNLMMKNIDTKNENQAYLAQQLLQAMVLGPPSTAPPVPTRTAGRKISLHHNPDLKYYTLLIDPNGVRYNKNSIATTAATTTTTTSSGLGIASRCKKAVDQLSLQKGLAS